MTKGGLVALLLGAVALALWALFPREREARWWAGSSELIGSEGSGRNELPGDREASSTPGLSFLGDGGTEEGPMRRLQMALAALRTSNGAEETSRVLAELREYFSSMPPGEAAAAMSEFLLDGSRDADTGIKFSVGSGGLLDGHPTLRVALLDWLGTIDRERAGLVAERILSVPTSADEWALALRNYARAHPDAAGREFLRAKGEELIRHPAWRESPTVGYLEAFDVLVHARSTESSALLSELVSNRTEAGRALAFASYLTLDRLTVVEPVAMMKEFAARPELHRVRGRMVANMYARADLRDVEQRQLVRGYLLDSARTSSELASFAGVFPNTSRTFSKNLLTENSAPGGGDRLAHDRAALEVVESWLQDPAFESVRPHLKNMHERLEEFVRQISRR